MNNDSERVLGMLSAGKITVEEAERLLEALGGHGSNSGPTLETRTPQHEDDEEEAQDERDNREPIWLGAGVQTGPGTHISPDVKFPPGSEIGAGATVREGVVVAGVVKIGAGAVIHEGTQLFESCDISHGAMVRPFAVIGKRAKVSEGAFIFKNAKIGEGAKIGVGAQIGEEAEVSPGARVPLGGQVPPGTVWQGVQYANGVGATASEEDFDGREWQTNT